MNKKARVLALWILVSMLLSGCKYMVIERHVPATPQTRAETNE